MELLSKRLLLRPLTEHDLDFYCELRNRPEVIAWSSGGERRSRSDIQRELRRWIERWAERRFGAWTVFDRQRDERLGRIELDPMGAGWVGVGEDEIELGYVIHPTHWNRGIATEAARLVIEDSFARLRPHRLLALTTTDNKPSVRVLAKLGMRCVGATYHNGGGPTYQLFELVCPGPPKTVPLNCETANG